MSEATETEESPQSSSAEARVTRRDIKIRDAQCETDEEYALQALRKFRDEFPDKVGRLSGVIFCSGDVEIYCYRTETQRIADVQKSAV